MSGPVQDPTLTASVAPRRLGDLGTRAASALVLVAVALVTTSVGGALFQLAWTAAGIAILWEWNRVTAAGLDGWRFVCGVATLVVVAVIVRDHLAAAALLLALSGVALGLAAAPGQRGWAAAGMLYAGLLVMAVIALRVSAPNGARAIAWLFATVWSTDVFAYFGGRLIGGKKLWPRISPSKTWAGTISGIVAGALVGTASARYQFDGLFALAPVLAVSVAASILAQAGDAFESGIKRRFGVKDSSNLIPGHGGVMDRLDGFIAAAIFAFALGLARHLPSIASGLFLWA